MQRYLLLTILACLLIGCAPATAPNGTPTPSGEKRYLVYTRHGGFAGKKNTWTIYEAGRIEADNGVRYQTTPEKARALFDQIGLESFLAESKNTPAPACADCISVTIAYHRDGQVNEVNLILETANPADPAVQWVARIEAFLSSSAQ